MKKTVNHLFLLFLISILSLPLQAQDIITSSGDYGSSASAKVTWTIGEPVTETITGTNVTLTQGFNQGDLIVTLVKDPELSGFNIKVFPNPVSDNLKISVEEDDPENFDYVLFDMGGRLIKNDRLNGAMSEIPVGNLSPSFYFLKIYKNNIEIAIFKITKTK